ncbi:hypothetical protein ACO0SA_000884 [Hanseniaspora valbyensis]
MVEEVENKSLNEEVSNLETALDDLNDHLNSINEDKTHDTTEEEEENDDDDDEFISKIKNAADVQKQKKLEEEKKQENEKVAKEEKDELVQEENEKETIDKEEDERVEKKEKATVEKESTSENNHIETRPAVAIPSLPSNQENTSTSKNKSPRASLIKLTSGDILTIDNQHPPLPPRRRSSVISHSTMSTVPHSIISDSRSSSIITDNNPFTSQHSIGNVKNTAKRNSLIKVTPVHDVPPPLKEELNNPTFLKNLKIITPPELPFRDISENSELNNAKISLAYDKEKQKNLNLDATIENQRSSSSQGLDISEKIDIIRENSKAVSPDFDLIINRFEINHGLRDISDAAVKGDELLKESFKKAIDDDEPKTDSLKFWNDFVLDYDSTVKKHPEELERLVFVEGIPSELRPFAWKFISQSNLKNLEILYANNVIIESAHAAQIEKDITRTNFIPLEKQGMLKNVCLAYSNYDLELGYTQGLCFIVAPLILTLDSEVEAFSLLVKLMHDYNLRSFYTNDMPGLMLKLYQFDKLVQEFSPAIHEHLAKCGIISNMFVSQWFLSFFGYKFPYEFVIRIYDIILIEGLEALLKFAIVIVLKNEKKILSMKFDELLGFLKDDLFNIYLMKDEEKEEQLKEEDNPDAESIVKIDLPKYDVTQFVLDAMEIKLMPISLKTIAAEYNEISQLKKSFNPADKEIERLKIINKNQVDELLKVKSSFNVLKKDHELIANELINKRQEIIRLNDQIDDLKEDAANWEKKYNQMIENSKLSNPDANIPTDLKEGIDQVLMNNKKVMERNLDLEHEVATLRELVDVLKLNMKEDDQQTEKKWKLFKK